MKIDENNFTYLQPENLKNIHLHFEPSDILDMNAIAENNIHITSISEVIAKEKMGPPLANGAFDQLGQKISTLSIIKKRLNIVTLTFTHCPVTEHASVSLKILGMHYELKMKINEHIDDTTINTKGELVYRKGVSYQSANSQIMAQITFVVAKNHYSGQIDCHVNAISKLLSSHFFMIEMIFKKFGYDVQLLTSKILLAEVLKLTASR